jgi:hypothetical protein
VSSHDAAVVNDGDEVDGLHEDAISELMERGSLRFIHQEIHRRVVVPDERDQLVVSIGFIQQDLIHPSYEPQRER